MPASGALKGKCVVVTRSAHQAASLHRLLQDRLAIPVAFPSLAIKPLHDSSLLDAHLRNLHEFDVLLLTSGNTVAALAQRMNVLNLQPDWARLRVASLGPATDESLRQLMHTTSDFIPEFFSAECLARTLPIADRDRILLPHSTLADEKTAGILRSRGAFVEATFAYSAEIGSGGENVPMMIAKNEIDALSFASPSALEYFKVRCPDPASLALPAACLGPATATVATKLGFQTVLCPHIPSLIGMINALDAYFATGDSTDAR